jgi:hypothetical protein
MARLQNGAAGEDGRILIDVLSIIDRKLVVNKADIAKQG